ncbi:MAG TPA: OmpH family outer membrane protein [Verrucomicrobiota bacterium]|nr:OmpH family outer membrane protein [Verrucomicrobiota bacterium]
MTKVGLLSMALACLTTSVTAQQPVKIATIDLLKAFDSYWKTKLSNEQLQERGRDFDKARAGLVKDLDQLREEYNRLNASIQDPANSDQKRAEDQKKAQEKLGEFERLKQQIIDFNKNAQKTLGDQSYRLRKSRLDEIKEIINAKAKELGYDWVIDSSQDVPLPRTPTILYTNGKNDITDAIIEILNVDATGKYKPTEPTEPTKPAVDFPDRDPAPTDK